MRTDAREALFRGADGGMVDGRPQPIRFERSLFLKIHGYATLQAQNGQTAIDLLKTMAAVPLRIVLDMSMPVLDGRGFLKRRAKDPVLLGIPVVVVSGNDAPASPPMNIKAYLRKPVSMQRLMSIIESAL